MANDRLEEALTDSRRAVALKPDLISGHANLGTCLDHLLRPDEALKSYQAVLALDPNSGDAIQFCRYVPLLAERGAILEIDRPLKELMTGVKGVAQCVDRTGALPDHDFHCPLASLPLAFDTRLETIPPVPQFSVHAPIGGWDALLGPHDRPRVGIVWSGNPTHANDHRRSVPFESLTPLFGVDATFVSLQKNAREADLALLRERSDVLDAASRLENFADTVSLIQHLDLVISVATSVAHLAGAIGASVWILLPYLPDYRWLPDRDDSPWYPTARLYRQTATRDYADVLGRVCADLSERISTWHRSK
jgi:hypothetical protein